jgi:hypothetical protein
VADANGKKGGLAAPYPPFKTFLATLDSFADFLPDQINSSVWMNYSGGVRSMLLATYRFFGLIDNEGRHTEVLAQLANNEQRRPGLLQDILKRSYPEIFKLDLSRTTPSTFDTAMRSYGLDGDTHRKAVAFFLAAAKYANVPLSPLLLKRGSRSTGAKKRAAQKPRIDSPATPPPAIENGSGPVKSVKLSGGATISLSASVDTFRMPSDDRKFVLELLDKLEEYEHQHPSDDELEDDDDQDGEE